jgi:uncharacterized protein
MRNLKYTLTAATMLTAIPAYAAPITFASFTPIASSVPGGSLPEDQPFLLSSPSFIQETIHANGPVGSSSRYGDNWDMNTLNENGPEAGRYLFTPYETSVNAGVRRFDLTTNSAIDLVSPGAQGFVVGDASRWTPFGTYLTAEESWGPGSTKGRLFEVTNPLGNPGSEGFTERNIIPRVSHEGLAFDSDNNLYFIDEFNGGSIYKYVSSTPNDGATFFSAGETFVLKVGAGGNTDALGAATWEKITNADGSAVSADPSATVIIDGQSRVDGRIAADLAGGTNFNRPEDLEIKTVAGQQVLYFAATASGFEGAGAVFSIALNSASSAEVKLFADRNTLKKNTAVAVGAEFLNPDNLAIDGLGNIYIIEDQPGGFADIWFAYDIDFDGIAESLGRWATLSTLGAEPTGLYFDPFDNRVAYINVQHAASDMDRTIRISINIVPEPVSVSLLAAGLGLVTGFARTRGKKKA